ncbi:MAG: hypothetical protein H6834_17910 [Planctomycetes bacterium]|nr:hypothetical protein [Planctomycetota bacterium]MCB9890927.1 hypothetical protein [Planctomycetota bacterium]
MRIPTCLLPVLVFLASSTSAQVVLEIHDGTTDFATRGSIPSNTTGWVVNRYARDAHGGGIGTVVGMRAVVQDNDCSTPNRAQLAVFGESPSVPGTPDERNQLATTGVFVLPTSGTGPCAWLLTVTFPTAVVHCPATQDVFTSVFLDAAPTWPNDGVAAHISLESPNVLAASQYPPTTPGHGAGATFGADFLAGSGGGMNTLYPATWRIYHAFAVIDAPAHVTRAGITNTQVLADYGMAGRFPDAVNRAGTTPPREDDPIWLGDAPGFTTGFAFLCLSPVHTGPIPLPGIGCLELATTNVFLPTVTVSGAQVSHGLSLGALGVRSLFTGGVDVWAQEVRYDPAAATVSIGSLARSTYY